MLILIETCLECHTNKYVMKKKVDWDSIVKKYKFDYLIKSFKWKYVVNFYLRKNRVFRVNYKKKFF